MKPVTLTTDFGVRDPYVAAMKGVLHSRCPQISIVDLTHEIAPQDVMEAALFLAAAALWFPAGTTHVVVVDPGVGAGRKPMAAALGGLLFVAPDNGVLSLLAGRMDGMTAFEIANPACMQASVSATFHGRDIFAPAAAALIQGMPLAEVGPPIKAPVELGIPKPSAAEGCVRGEIVHIDHFGNAISNVPRRILPEGVHPVIEAAGLSLPLLRTYSDAAPGKPLALFGSSGFIEIAVNHGSAEHRLGLKRGNSIEAFWERK